MCPTIRFTDAHIADYERPNFPGYVSLLRMAVNDGQANRPRYVGSTSETANSLRLSSFEQYQDNHLERNPNWLSGSLQRTIEQLETMRTRINDMINSPHTYIEPYIEDLVFASSYRGHRIEQEILRAEGGGSYEPPSAEDESNNIDGYIDNISYSVKPDSWFNDDRNGPTLLGDDTTRVIQYSYRREDDEIVVDYEFVRNKVNEGE
jgi:hypothetical protein